MLWQCLWTQHMSWLHRACVFAWFYQKSCAWCCICDMFNWHQHRGVISWKSASKLTFHKYPNLHCFYAILVHTHHHTTHNSNINNGAGASNSCKRKGERKGCLNPQAGFSPSMLFIYHHIHFICSKHANTTSADHMGRWGCCSPTLSPWFQGN